jgi:hypothetical protein
MSYARAMFDDRDLDDILAALRDGADYESSSSGGRYATKASYRDGAYRVERFEEGVVDEYRFDAAGMRAFILRCGDDDDWLRVLVDRRRRR